MAVAQVQIINGQKTLVPVSGSAPTDSVTSGNMNPVTSNAVAEALKYTYVEVGTSVNDKLFIWKYSLNICLI